MKYFGAILIILAGCSARHHTHQHSHPEISRNAVRATQMVKEGDYRRHQQYLWDSIASVTNDEAALSWRIACDEINLKYLSKKVNELLKRIKTLERVTGGRRHALKKDLIELEEKDD